MVFLRLPLWPRSQPGYSPPFWRLVAIATAYTVIVSQPWVFVVAVFIDFRVLPECNRDTLMGLIVPTVIAPIIENLLMVGIMELLARITKKDTLSTTIAACLLALSHSYFEIQWGLVVIWSWLIFAHTYRALRPTGKLKAYIGSSIVHGASNAVIMLISKILCWTLPI